MKTVFINLALRPESERRQLPVGLAYVLTAVKKAGFEFDLIDMDIERLSLENVEKVLEQTVYDIYALGCIVTGFKFVKVIADIAKKVNPESLVISGNSVATSIPELLLKNTEVDIGVMGEADITIVELLKALDSGRDYRTVKGIAFIENGQVCYSTPRQIMPELDPIGFPDWDMFDLAEYNKCNQVSYEASPFETVSSFPINAARGCPFSCTFCYHVFKGQKYRRYSEFATTEEIKRLHFKYGADYISFWDELTFANVKSVRMLVDCLGSLDFKIGWMASCRAGLFRKKHVGLVRELKEAGCDGLGFSLENASREILKAMNKNITVDQFIEQSETLTEGGVRPLTSLVFGYPQETPETIIATLDVCEKCNIFPSVGFLLPLPGTPVYQWARFHGYITDEVEYLERIGDRQDFHINLTMMEDSEFVGIVSDRLEMLAEKQGLKLQSVFKTGTYQKPKAKL